MTTKEIIETKLNFLITEYGFDYEYIHDMGDHYYYKNKYGYIEFYEWEEFQEDGFYVTYDMLSKKIILIEEYPKIAGRFYQTHKGIKWFFKDIRYDY